MNQTESKKHSGGDGLNHNSFRCSAEWYRPTSTTWSLPNSELNMLMHFDILNTWCEWFYVNFKVIQDKCVVCQVPVCSFASVWSDLVDIRAWISVLLTLDCCWCPPRSFIPTGRVQMKLCEKNGMGQILLMFVHVAPLSPSLTQQHKCVVDIG